MIPQEFETLPLRRKVAGVVGLSTVAVLSIAAASFLAPLAAKAILWLGACGWSLIPWHG